MTLKTGRWGVLALMAALALQAGAAQARTSEDHEARWARIERSLTPLYQVQGRQYEPQSLSEVMAQNNVPAVSIAFVDDGRIVRAVAYGQADAETGAAATPETLFQAASVSKAVAATAMLDLVEAGALSLDAPVNDQMTGWRLPQSEFTDRTPPTLRMLLNHTAGVTVHGFPGYASGEPIPTALQILAGEPPANTDPILVDTPPGVAWRYSGGGYVIAQVLAAEAAGEDFDALARRLVFEPWGMSSSSYRQPLDGELRLRAASAHDAQGRPVEGGSHAYPELAAAGLWTTPSDLARWLIGVSEARAGRDDRVLEAGTARAMTTAGLGEWGLGVQVRGEGDGLEFRHTGSNEGFRSVVVAFPERRQGVVVMMNGEAGAEVMGPIVQAVAQEYGWPHYPPRAIPFVATPSETLAQLAGAYGVAPRRLEVEMSPSGDTLSLQLGRRRLELIPQGGDVFLESRGLGRAEFERGDDGAVVAISLNGARFERQAP
ncbi:serine hydrolase domain-containing protein [Brevundimonas sp. 2R-24]|uniref:Serine hydrolase domain-containing protein n=1 Tax=Peiella sedimenti TaxID=3061083 RepID=A0ABT8SP83_9CAUL|nr:serine hydrolase domain-containing protein [Caulobacteraceae bacterium XZ-24]